MPKGIINKDGKMVTGPKAEMELMAMKIMKDSKKGMKKNAVKYKSGGGKMSKYYSGGGTVFTGRD